MDNLMQVIEVIGYIIAIGVLGWLIKIVSTLKVAIDSQKAVIESLRANMGYVEGLQSTVSKLYDPSEVEKLVSIKVQNQVLEKESEIRKQGEKETIESWSIFLSYISVSTVYLSDEKIKAVLKTLESRSDYAFLEDYVWKCRSEVLKVRNDAIEELEAKVHNNKFYSDSQRLVP